MNKASYAHKWSIALIGVGRIGVGHAAALAKMNEVELTVCDTVGGRAEDVATQLGVQHANVEEIFENTARYSGIVITSPTSTHQSLIERCARAKLPVFCEKPVAIGLDEALDCVEAVHASEIPTQIGFQRRFDAGYIEARRRVTSGELGEIHRIHMLTCDQAPPPEQFVASSGGIFRDCLIHDFDILRWVTGREVKEVFAYGAVRSNEYFTKYGDADEAVVVLRMDDDTLVTAQASRNNGQGYDVRMDIAGTKGTAAVGLEPKVPVVSAEPGVVFPEGKPWVDFIARFQECYEKELRAFVDVVASRSSSPCTIDDGLEALRIALAATRSLREGRPVRVDEIRENRDLQKRSQAFGNI